MASPLTPEILEQQKERHLAFLAARLVSPAAEAEWRAHAASVLSALLAARVGDVVDPGTLADALDATLTGDAVERVARPLAKHLLPLILAELRAEKGTVRARVPASALSRLEALLSRPGLLPERLLTEIAGQDAIDEIMRDVLYDGFKEFSEKVNPFTAEWGIPSLLKRMSVLGGAVGKGIESVKVEFDRRLEPEIRRFLAGFSRRGLLKMVEATIARADQPASVALRRHLLAWALDQEIAVLAREADPEALSLMQEIGLDVAAAELGRAAGKDRRRALIAAAFATVEDRTVAEALAGLGVTLPEGAHEAAGALAAATWPAVRAALGSGAVQAWLAGVVGEFYDTEITATAGLSPHAGA